MKTTISTLLAILAATSITASARAQIIEKKSLTLDGAKPGKTVTVSFAAPNPSNGPFYAVFITGISTPLFVLIQDGNKVEVPVDLLGTVYCVITNSGTEVNDATTVAGPAILSFEFNSEGKMVG